MRRVVLSVVLAAGLAASLPAVAQEQTASGATPAAKPGKPGKDDPNRIVCTREHVVGSNRPVKVCKTAAQRELEKDAATRELDETRRRGEQSPGSVG